MRLEQLTFTRFIAAIAIVIFHYGKDSILFSNQYVSFIFQQANLGVSYFFVLSGFVMIIAYNNQNKIIFLDFVKNRIARIYPSYILAIVLMLCISLFKEFSTFDLALNIFMVQAWVAHKAMTINPPGWSLSVELFFYLTFPFLVNEFYKKFNFKIIFNVIVFIWIISQILFHLIINQKLKIPYYELKEVNYNPILHINQFFIGNLAGLIFLLKLKNKQKNYSPLIILIFLILILILKTPSMFNYHNGLLAVVFATLIVLISSTASKITQFFSNNTFLFLGEISFGMYIFQVPVWTLFSTYRMEKYFSFNRESDATILFFIRLMILIAFASFSYLYIEKPLRHKIRSLF